MGGCWKPKSKGEKVLLALSIILVIVTIGLIIGLAVKSKETKSSKAEPIEKSLENTCTTKACIGSALEFLKNMDPNEDPCNDFYQFACGGYANRTDLSETATNKFAEISIKNLDNLQKIISQPWKESEPKYYKLIKDFYSSCINVAKLEELGNDPMLSKLTLFGGWPVIEGSNWNENSFDWTETTIKLRQTGLSFFSFFIALVTNEMTNTTAHILSIGEPSTTLPVQFYDVSSLRLAYLQHMVTIAVLLGAKRSTAEKDMKDVIDLEEKITRIKLPIEEQRDFTKLNNVMTVKDLGRLMPAVSWINFLNRMKFSILITPNTKVVVVSPNTMKEVSRLLLNTSKRTISNYMLWRVVFENSEYLGKEIQDAHFKALTQITGSPPPKDRKQYCTSQTQGSFAQGVGAMFVRELFDKESKQLSTELVSYIKAELTLGVSNSQWMDPVTLNEAKKKVSEMKEFVAYPDQVLDDDIINNFYKTLNISENGLFDNVLQLGLLELHRLYDLLDKTSNEVSWVSFADSSKVNAENAIQFNRIQIFAGILGGAFFNRNRPKYLNFGGIGAIIGHEFVHGFDDSGKQFDEHGNLRNWWANETAQKFREKADMVVQQFSNFEVPEINMKINGLMVQGEAISDMEGLKLSYRAYTKWVEKNKEELSLPGLALNPKQLFWLKAANVWCSNPSPDSLRFQIQTDTHPPERFRVIGPFVNIEYFSNDFNCPVGSPMNPKEKISFW